MEYTELHLHTQYSILDGLSTPREYCERAKELGIENLAITDHSTMTGHIDMLKACIEFNIKAILGVEAHYSASTDGRFDRRSKAKRQEGEDMYNHLILLAKNENGLKNLHKIEESAWTEGFYGKPRCDWELLDQFGDDLIITSACVSGLIARNLINDREDEALMWLNKFKDRFGEDFYVEIQEHNEQISKNLNHRLLDIADNNNVKTIITSDCHFHSPEVRWIEEALLILNTNPKKNPDADLSKARKMDLMDRFNYLYPERQMTFEHIDVYLQSAETLHQKMQKQGIDRTDIFSNTMEIASKIG
ncbi:DNA polymerase III alpha subunit [Rhodococcus phage Trina]|uniref:DNA polymerase III alpha subunit n=1 Tax=Rhodococcus phage Trina TaxID=2027905 RepID=A0A2D0ZM71_9CAUD|nr:DNA polymerase III alpha subunit [Rhodococcus phage Trina]ASZ74915.1 DNA polymerase III alpha subunit [Rhodococcus phage Trina]